MAAAAADSTAAAGGSEAAVAGSAAAAATAAAEEAISGAVASASASEGAAGRRSTRLSRTSRVDSDFLWAMEEEEDLPLPCSETEAESSLPSECPWEEERAVSVTWEAAWVPWPPRKAVVLRVSAMLA